MNELIQADEGFFFGIGAFETIGIENGSPAFLKQHLQRLQKTLEFLEIEYAEKDILDALKRGLATQCQKKRRHSLKLVVSEKNIVVKIDKNHYSASDYQRGFITSISQVRRNETSPYTFHKTLNYADCICEKRHAQKHGIDEPLFLNTTGSLTEGATTNLFFVKDNAIVTPPVVDGLLPGIMRSFVCESFNVKERTVHPEEVRKFDEMFLTNSLMLAMPVVRLDNTTFQSNKMANLVRKRYCYALSTQNRFCL